MAARIEMDQCMGCGNCLAACPRGLLRLTGAERTNSRGVRYAQLSSPDACMDCGTCELMCTAGAIRADRSPAVSGYDLIRKDKVPPHAGCYLGTLSKVLADEIVRLGIQQDAVIFEKTGSNIYLDIETHAYENNEFYEDGLRYKREHPEKIVILICASSKAGSTAQNVKWLGALKQEKVTIIKTLNWFEPNETMDGIQAGCCHHLEELAKQGNASLLARAGVRTPAEVTELRHLVGKALENQIANKPFSVVEMLFPCFYRVGNRPGDLMPYEDIKRINVWFDACVVPDYEYKVYLDH